MVIDMEIDMAYGISIGVMVYRHGHPPYRYGHPGYRYGIWSNDMGDDSIDMVISHIDMGYLVTLSVNPAGNVVCLHEEQFVGHQAEAYTRPLFGSTQALHME
jgi:hypothetical protein